jgi:DNA primase
MRKDYTLELEEYKSNLWDKEVGKPARLFLKNRKIYKSTAEAWNMGYCPKNYVPKYYKDEKYPFWEKMQGRIILPVFDSNGDLLTLSGRAISDDIKPKYMHYTFPTGKTLFGLYINEKDILKKNAIIFTEGQFDVISAWQHGLRNVACTFGSHFSSDQILLSARYTDRVYILYDDDDAGQEGARKSLEKIKIRGDVKISLLKGILKNGEDLDDWVKHNNCNFFDKIFNSSKEDLLKYKLSLIKS